MSGRVTVAEFEEIFDAVKNWETGRRVPDRSATTLLTIIERNPKAVINALHQQSAKKTRKIA